MKSLKKYMKIFSNILRNFRYCRIGRCNVCGNKTIFLCQDVPAARNNMTCLFCHSSSRKRHVALQIVETINLPKIRNIKKSAAKSTLKIYNTDYLDALYKYFKNNENYISSLYSEEIPAGTCIKNNVFCQNLEHLTFENNSFDIVISEDVLEHIRDYKKALREIHRVLKNDGVHIFTIPFYFDKETIVRIDTSQNEDIHLLPAEYHGDNIRGKIITYNNFGIDLFSVLNDIGFDTTVHFNTLEEAQCGIFNSFVFVSKKK